MVRQAAKLLLVDDDPSLLKLLGMRLRSEGYQVTTAASGPEALRLLQKEKIELVISDLRMDEMDGLALFGEIQKRHTGLPVIILTAHGSIPDVLSATQQGVFTFLTPPLDNDPLYYAIHDAPAQQAPVSDDSCQEPTPHPSPTMLRLRHQAHTA
ncbi:MAG TPA: two-component system response regulator GlrR, partial [Pantoea agglomerans]|nr:two-component system response regulator GlrR [Pantoea agglomerans]